MDWRCCERETQANLQATRVRQGNLAGETRAGQCQSLERMHTLCFYKFSGFSTPGTKAVCVHTQPVLFAAGYREYPNNFAYVCVRMRANACVRSKAWLAVHVSLRLARMPHPAWVRHSHRLRATFAAAPVLFAHDIGPCHMERKHRVSAVLSSMSCDDNSSFLKAGATASNTTRAQ